MDNVTRILANNIEPFKPLLPGEYVEEVVVGKSLGIGALDEGVAAGAAIFYVDFNPDAEKGIIRVKWFYVHTKHRQRRMADALLDTLITVAKEFDVEAITVDFQENAQGMKEYLEKRGFSLDQGFGPEIGLSLSDIKDHKTIMSFCKGVQSLVEVEESQVGLFVKRYMKKNGYKGFLFSKNLPGDYIDEDISCFIGSIENPRGMLIAHHIKQKKVIVEFLCSEDRESIDEVSLVCFACQETMRKYSRDTIVVVKPETWEFVLNIDAEQLFKKYMVTDTMEGILLKDDF